MPYAKRTCRLLAAALLATAAGGCKVAVDVQQYPAFYDPALKSVVVLDFTNATPHDRAGEYVAKHLARALRANGTYQVIGPRQLSEKLQAASLTLPAYADAETTAATLRQLGDVQAFVTGSVKVFSIDCFIRTRSYFHAGYGWGHWLVGLGGGFPAWHHQTHVRARVAADATFIAVEDGQILHATPMPVAGKVTRRGYPSTMGEEVLAEAAGAVANSLVEAFAIVPKQVRLSAGKTLRTARYADDEKLKYTDDFRSDDERMVVVLRLPAEAARNPFRLTIARKGRDEVLAERDFVWSAEDQQHGFTFSPRDLAQAGGVGDYDVHLYAGDRLVLKQDFEIDPN